MIIIQIGSKVKQEDVYLCGICGLGGINRHLN